MGRARTRKWRPTCPPQGEAERSVASLTRAKVEVTDNQIEAALKTLKKVMIKGGLYQAMQRRVYYEKPSVKRKRKQAQARKKRRRALKRSRVDDED